MPRVRPKVLILVMLLTCAAAAWDRPLFAQGSELGLSPADQKKYDDLIRSAKRNEMIGYVAVGAGFLFSAAFIPLSSYFVRKKKARQRASQQEAPGPDKAPPPKNR